MTWMPVFGIPGSRYCKPYFCLDIHSEEAGIRCLETSVRVKLHCIMIQDLQQQESQLWQSRDSVTTSRWALGHFVRRLLQYPDVPFGYFRLLSDVSLPELSDCCSLTTESGLCHAHTAFICLVGYDSQNGEPLFSPNTVNRLIILIETQCFLWNKNWIFKCYLYELHSCFRLLMLYFSVCLLA
jgi:hypothetical protein